MDNFTSHICSLTGVPESRILVSGESICQKTTGCSTCLVSPGSADLEITESFSHVSSIPLMHHSKPLTESV